MKISLLKTDYSELWCITNFISEQYSAQIYNELKVIKYEIEPLIFIYGQVRNQKRNVSFLSDESIGYKYSNQIIRSCPLHEYKCLTDLLNLVNETLNTKFNGLLINRYVDGSKYIGPHSDDEK